MKIQSYGIQLLMIPVYFLLFECDLSDRNSDNMLLKPWTGPYGGVPDFDKVKVEDIENGMLHAKKLRLLPMIRQLLASKIPLLPWKEVELS